jgi:hypothetical protein
MLRLCSEGAQAAACLAQAMPITEGIRHCLQLCNTNNYGSWGSHDIMALMAWRIVTTSVDRGCSHIPSSCHVTIASSTHLLNRTFHKHTSFMLSLAVLRGWWARGAVSYCAISCVILVKCLSERVLAGSKGNGRQMRPGHGDTCHWAVGPVSWYGGCGLQEGL